MVCNLYLVEKKKIYYYLFKYWLKPTVCNLYLVEKKRFIIIYLSIVDVENCGSFKSLSFIYIYIDYSNNLFSMMMNIIYLYPLIIIFLLKRKKKSNLIQLLQGPNL